MSQFHFQFFKRQTFNHFSRNTRKADCLAKETLAFLFGFGFKFTALLRITNLNFTYLSFTRWRERTGIICSRRSLLCWWQEDSNRELTKIKVRFISLLHPCFSVPIRSILVKNLPQTAKRSKFKLRLKYSHPGQEENRNSNSTKKVVPVEETLELWEIEKSLEE